MRKRIPSSHSHLRIKASILRYDTKTGKVRQAKEPVTDEVILAQLTGRQSYGDGATNKEVFKVYVEKFLLPTLNKGDAVILDNLSAHKCKEIRELIESVGAELWYLPPYSPDLNPIEKMWSKIKAILRALKVRTEKELINAIAKALEAVTANDVKGWFKSCGYIFS